MSNNNRTDNIYSLPDNLPVPEDDGACDHLLYKKIPSINLSATNGNTVNLANIGKTTVVFCYPRTGRPDQNPPIGWNDIPGARGCTPQTCAFRDLYSEFHNLGIEVFGLSTQTSEYQHELQQRLDLPFSILSDYKFDFINALNLPTFSIAEMKLIKRLTLIIDSNGIIQKVFYPVFPPTLNGIGALDWIKQNMLNS